MRSSYELFYCKECDSVCFVKDLRYVTAQWRMCEVCYEKHREAVEEARRELSRRYKEGF